MHFQYQEFKGETFSTCSKNSEFKSTTYAQSQRKNSMDFNQFGIKYKTEVCNYWKTGEICPFGDICSFAHGDIELRPKEYLPNNYKTKACSNYSGSNYCLYGKRCQFIHTDRRKTKLKKKRMLNMFADDPQMLCLLRGSIQVKFHNQKSQEYDEEKFEEQSTEFSQEMASQPSEILELISQGFKKPRLNSL